MAKIQRDVVLERCLQLETVLKMGSTHILKSKEGIGIVLQMVMLKFIYKIK